MIEMKVFDSGGTWTQTFGTQKLWFCLWRIQRVCAIQWKYYNWRLL